MEGLDNWLLAHGGACSRSVRLGESRRSGRGLYAARPVAGGDVLLVVPHALLLTATPRSHSAGALAKTDRLILALLQKKAAMRLGCLSGGFADLRSHDYFDGFAWAALQAQAMPPPFLPTLHARAAAVQRG